MFNLIYKKLTDNYVTSINELNKRYEVILIDGRKRVECARNALSFLTSKGIVILDNSERERYDKIWQIFNSAGFYHLTFSGLKAIGFRIAKTTIFYKHGNCLGI